MGKKNPNEHSTKGAVYVSYPPLYKGGTWCRVGTPSL